MDADLLVTPDGTIRAYDVIQILNDRGWEDYGTIRTVSDAQHAYALVKGTHPAGHPVKPYRIVTRDGFIT